MIIPGPLNHVEGTIRLSQGPLCLVDVKNVVIPGPYSTPLSKQTEEELIVSLAAAAAAPKGGQEE